MLLLSGWRLVEGRGLIGAAVVFLLCGVRGTGALALLGLVAPCDHVLGDLIVSGQVAGRLATWLHGASFRSATFGFQQLRNRNKLIN